MYYELGVTRKEYEELKVEDSNPKNYNYNCHSAAISGSLHKSLDYFGYMQIDLRDEIIKRDFMNVPAEKAIFGRTVISFGYQRDALFLGKSRDGIVMVFTKNGPYFAPKVMTLDKLVSERPYGFIRNIDVNIGLSGTDGSGYYNPKNNK